MAGDDAAGDDAAAGDDVAADDDGDGDAFAAAGFAITALRTAAWALAPVVAGADSRAFAAPWVIGLAPASPRGGSLAAPTAPAPAGDTLVPLPA